MNRRLKVIAARHALGLATADEMIDAAHAALDDGIYGYSLGELATQTSPLEETSYRLFGDALKELGIGVPGRNECISILIEDAVTRIIEGAEPSPSVIGRLYSDYVSLNYPNQLRNWAEHQYAIEEQVAFAAEPMFHMPLVDPGPDEVLEKIRAAIAQHARTWNRDRWRPVIQPAWLSSTVLALAAGIRDDRAFDRLPILADALQDAGCENDDILGHLRHAAKHDRACWVVELLTEFGASGG